MKIGAVIIHSSKYTKRKIYVDRLIDFFKNTEVEVNIIEGVFTDDIYYDARHLLHNNKISRGSIGNSLAQLNALKLSLEKNYDYVYIFEDDVRIEVPSYIELKKWINTISVSYDVLLLTNVGDYTGKGHDGRDHYKVKVSDDLYQGSCLFGTMAYYINKDTTKILYETQQKEIDKQRIFIADGLHIHCEKESGLFLNTITPIDTNRFFIHEGYESITVDVNNN
jgi:GR25 family glycosyltransferase involved in LPS biosynthesis